MSNLDTTPSLTHAGLAQVSATPAHQLFTGREVLIGESTKVRRLLPNLGRRLVGAWCFVDHYGPDDIANESGMQVLLLACPHMGLQTVTWLVEGEVHHRDSIGSDALIRPGELGLMTAQGHAITHAEVLTRAAPGRAARCSALGCSALAGARDGVAAWEHHAELPRLSDVGMGRHRDARLDGPKLDIARHHPHTDRRRFGLAHRWWHRHAAARTRLRARRKCS